VVVLHKGTAIAELNQVITTDSNHDQIGLQGDRWLQLFGNYISGLCPTLGKEIEINGIVALQEHLLGELVGIALGLTVCSLPCTTTISQNQAVEARQGGVTLRGNQLITRREYLSGMGFEGIMVHTLIGDRQVNRHSQQTQASIQQDRRF